MSSIHSTIPVVDINDYYNKTNKNRFLKTLRQAFTEVGFAAVLNTNIDKNLLEKVYEQAKRFFAQKQEIKDMLKDSSVSYERGYVNIESPKEVEVGKMDTKEFYHIGPLFSEKEMKNLGYHQNIWPKNSTFKEQMEVLYTRLEKAAQTIAGGISMVLSKPPSFIQDKVHKGEHLLKIIHYPANLPKSENWAAEHTDFNFFTLLPQSTGEGLQVKTKEGKWVDVKTPDNALIINVGDMLQNLSNGYLRSSVHRVLYKGGGNDRYSIVMFGHTRNQVDLSPMKEFIGTKQLYPNATRKELLDYYLISVGRASRESMSRVVQAGMIERFKKYDNPGAKHVNEKVIAVLKQNGFLV